MKIGVYVGSFDPPHNGHAKVMNYLIEENYVDKLLVIPTISYWNKTNRTDIFTRATMLKYLETDNITIDTKYSNYPYTYQILDALKKDYPNDSFYLIIGADNMKDFKLWKNVDEILKNYVIVLNRSNLPIKKYVTEFQNYDKFIVVDDYPFVDVSSTEIRNLIRERKLKDCHDLIDHNVYKYIELNNLYNIKEEL